MIYKLYHVEREYKRPIQVRVMQRDIDRLIREQADKKKHGIIV